MVAFSRKCDRKIVIARSYSDLHILIKVVFFFLRLDKRSERAEQTKNKRWKRTTARTGQPVEKEPPANTPKWALSDEWKDELRRRDEEMIQLQEFEAER